MLALKLDDVLGEPVAEPVVTGDRSGASRCQPNAVARPYLHISTYATISLASGVPINVVSQRLGHANTSVTLNVYSHVMPGMQAAAAQGVADFISGTDNSGSAADTASKLTRNTRHGPWRRHLE